MRWEKRSYGRPGGGRCEYGRWSNTFTMRLAFIRTLGGTFGGDPRRIFRKAFRRTRVQRWPVGGKFIFTFKGTFISTFTFMIRTTAGTLSGRRSAEKAADPTGRVLSVNWDMYPEGLPEGGAAFTGYAGSFGVRARACRRRVLWTSGRRLRRVRRLC